MACPLHRIEVWTGTFFRPAALWETGVYLLIKHHSHPIGKAHCETLTFQRKHLERFQCARDDVEQERAGQDRTDQGGYAAAAANDPCLSAPDFSVQDQSLDQDMAGDVRFDRRLNAVYADLDGPEMDEDDEEIVEDHLDALPLPRNYMPDRGFEAPQSRPQSPSRPPGQDASQSAGRGDIPAGDSFNNPYVRVVHTNGIHHLALVYCNCQGREATHCDIMAQSLIPTSFTRYQTLFTHAVLDDYRITSLECKASAYQYFQKIKRHTSAMFPDTVPNLYHELRRMSRIWRWLKKLKWAGFGHKTTDTTEAAPGELAIFCPACPQPGLNLSKTWDQDPQRSVTSERQEAY